MRQAASGINRDNIVRAGANRYQHLADGSCTDLALQDVLRQQGRNEGAGGKRYSACIQVVPPRAVRWPLQANTGSRMLSAVGFVSFDFQCQLKTSVPSRRFGLLALRHEHVAASIVYRVVSMKVTLLISFRVVMPALTLARADSRRKCIPSSRAALRISELGRFSRIISRMRSVNSSSS